MMRRQKTRANLSMECYMREISEVPLLTPEEEIELARRIKKGDQEALEQLTRANLRFVVSITKKYQNKGLAFGDLINEGNIGLIRAAKRFDETRGFKFISYAVWWIRQAVLQALAEQSRVVRLPLNRITALNKIGKAFNHLEQAFERPPSASEIAKATAMTAHHVADNLKISGKHLSLDASIMQGEEISLLDVTADFHQPSPDDWLLHESLRNEIKRALCKLPKREAEVIKMYFGLDGTRNLNLEEIGQEFNLTRERVRQIKEKGLGRLRHISRSRALQQYLG
ncbi:RNA polymerase sigma factor RpoD/SigA [bacterium]|nr:RNA polymerase sigma factor RpoD/SigA [bacterium]